MSADSIISEQVQQVEPPQTEQPTWPPPKSNYVGNAAAEITVSAALAVAANGSADGPRDAPFDEALDTSHGPTAALAHDDEVWPDIAAQQVLGEIVPMLQEVQSSAAEQEATHRVLARTREAAGMATAGQRLLVRIENAAEGPRNLLSSHHSYRLHIQILTELDMGRPLLVLSKAPFPPRQVLLRARMFQPPCNRRERM